MFTLALIVGLNGTPILPPPNINPPIIFIANKKRSDVHRGTGRRDEN